MKKHEKVQPTRTLHQFLVGAASTRLSSSQANREIKSLYTYHRMIAAESRSHNQIA
jgi:hypothetical protein